MVVLDGLIPLGAFVSDPGSLLDLGSLAGLFPLVLKAGREVVGHDRGAEQNNEYRK